MDNPVWLLRDALEEMQIAMSRAQLALDHLSIAAEDLSKKKKPDQPPPSPHDPSFFSSSSPPPPTGEKKAGSPVALVRSQGEILRDMDDRDLRRRAAAFLGCRRVAEQRPPCGHCKRATLAFLHVWDQSQQRDRWGGGDSDPQCQCESCVKYRGCEGNARCEGEVGFTATHRDATDT